MIQRQNQSNFFVAKQGDANVAQVFFTAVRIEPREVSTQILAPLAGSSERQRSRLGTRLVNEHAYQIPPAKCVYR